MSRSSWLMPLLGWLVLGGCGSSDDDADGLPSESTRAEVSFAVSAPRCTIGEATPLPYTAMFGQPVLVTIASANVTESCSSNCTSTLDSGWSCGRTRQCSGGYEQFECREVRRTPTTLGSATVTVDRDDCTITADGSDTSKRILTMTCTAEGLATLSITPPGGATTFVPVFYSERGLCPSPEVADAGMADGTMGASTAKRLFVTSPVSGNLGGVSGADARCQELASAAGVTGTWRAVLGVNLADALTRFVGSGPFVSMAPAGASPEVVFATRADLGTGPLDTLAVDATGAAIPSSDFWSGVGGTSLDCAGWTTSAAATRGTVGSVSPSGGKDWLNIGPGGCDSERAVVCVEQ